MQQNHKGQPTTRSTLPERHFEMRIGEGLFVIGLFAILMLVIF